MIGVLVWMIVVLAAVPWHFPPDSSDVVVRDNTRPPAVNIGGITFVGEMVVFSHPLDPRVPQVDSFVVELPDTTRAFCALIVGGIPVPLRTVRDLKIPPWVPGNDPKLGLPTTTAALGIAWHSFEYDADTLVAWGYAAGDSQYVGHLQVRTNIKVRPDSNAVFSGYWRSYGSAVPIQIVAKIPPIKRIRDKYAKLIDQYALRQQQ